MQDAKCRRIGGYAMGGVCLAAALVSMAGCETAKSRKAALTEHEIRRLTLAQKPDRPDRLIVSGETITWEDILASLPEDTATTATLKERLQTSAQEA